MAILINQGVQDTSQDISFEVIEEKGVLATITDIALSTYFENAIRVEFTITRGKYNGRKVWSDYGYAPNDKFAWRYRKLREGAGCPYVPGEPGTIDIEGLLLRRPVVLDLTKNKAQDGKEYQRVDISKTSVASLMQPGPTQGFGQQPPRPATAPQPQHSFGQPAAQPRPQVQPQQWGAPQPAHATTTVHANPPIMKQAELNTVPHSEPAPVQQGWAEEEPETLSIASDDLPF